MVLGAGVSVYKNELSRSISCYTTLNTWSSTKEMQWDCFQLLPGSLSESPPLFQLPPLLFSSSFFLGILLKVCPCGGSQLSDRGIIRSLICTSGFSYTFPPTVIKNILGDKKNPCLTPEITGTRDDGFSFMHNFTNKSIRD